MACSSTERSDWAFHTAAHLEDEPGHGEAHHHGSHHQPRARLIHPGLRSADLRKTREIRPGRAPGRPERPGAARSGVVVVDDGVIASANRAKAVAGMDDRLLVDFCDLGELGQRPHRVDVDHREPAPGPGIVVDGDPPAAMRRADGIQLTELDRHLDGEHGKSSSARIAEHGEQRDPRRVGQQDGSRSWRRDCAAS